MTNWKPWWEQISLFPQPTSPAPAPSSPSEPTTSPAPAPTTSPILGGGLLGGLLTPPETSPPPTPSETAPQGGRPGFDFFSSQAPYYGGTSLPRGTRFRTLGRFQDIVAWELEIWDLRSGLNRTVGDLEVDYDRSSSSTLDGRFYRTLMLPQATSSQTSPDPATTLRGMHSVNHFDSLIIGVGGDNDVSLFKETSATDPTIVAITGVGTAGRPGDEIVSLSKAVIGSATVDERVIIGLQGNPALVMGDASGTIDATMHANTTGLSGLIQTPLNTDAILLYANGSLYSLLKTAAATDAPTTILSNVPQGGYALGMLQLGGGPLRAYWVWPYETVTAGILTFGSEKKGRIISTNLEGTDPQELKMFAGGVLAAAIVPSRSGIIASDGERVLFHNGRSITDTKQFADREPNSDREYRVRGFAVFDPDVYVRVNHIASPSGSGDTREWWEQYHFETGAWHQISATTGLSVTGVQGILAAGSHPVSLQNNFLHRYSDGRFRRIRLETPGHNTFTQDRQSSGAGSSTGVEFESSGTWTSPYWELPGMHGMLKVATEVCFLGDLQAGGTAATAAHAEVTVNGVEVQFTTGHANRSQWARLPHAVPFYQLRMTETLTRTTNSTRFTPNGLPIIVRGFTFLNTRVPTEEAMLVMKEAIKQWGYE